MTAGKTALFVMVTELESTMAWDRPTSGVRSLLPDVFTDPVEVPLPRCLSEHSLYRFKLRDPLRFGESPELLMVEMPGYRNFRFTHPAFGKCLGHLYIGAIIFVSPALWFYGPYETLVWRHRLGLNLAACDLLHVVGHSGRVYLGHTKNNSTSNRNRHL